MTEERADYEPQTRKGLSQGELDQFADLLGRYLAAQDDPPATVEELAGRLAADRGIVR